MVITLWILSISSPKDWLMSENWPHGHPCLFPSYSFSYLHSLTQSSFIITGRPNLYRLVSPGWHHRLRFLIPYMQGILFKLHANNFPHHLCGSHVQYLQYVWKLHHSCLTLNFPVTAALGLVIWTWCQLLTLKNPLRIRFVILLHFKHKNAFYQCIGNQKQHIKTNFPAGKVNMFLNPSTVLTCCNVILNTNRHNYEQMKLKLCNFFTHWYFVMYK